MKKQILYWLLCGCLGCFAAPATAEDAVPLRSSFWGAIAAHADLETLGEPFGMAEREMQHMVTTFGDSGVDNHFCALGYRLDRRASAAALGWREWRQAG